MIGNLNIKGIKIDDSSDDDEEEEEEDDEEEEEEEDEDEEEKNENNNQNNDDGNDSEESHESDEENDEEEEEDNNKENNQENQIFNTKKKKLILDLNEFQYKHIKKYSKIKEKKCSICLVKYKKSDLIKELPCNHIFHKNCILKWIEISNVCPICKYDITEDVNKIKLKNSSDEECKESGDEEEQKKG